MFQLDLESLKSVIEITSFIIGGFWFISNLKYQINSIITQHAMEFDDTNKQFREIEGQLKELIKATVQLARQEERLNAQDLRLQELSQRIEVVRGKGKTVVLNATSPLKRSKKSA